jgi:NAD+ kinase
VLLVGDERKGGVRELVQRFADSLRGRCATVEIALDRTGPLATGEIDLVVVFGGDGSILSTARRMGEHQRPTLGINLGRLGFLAPYRVQDADDAISLALAGKLYEEQHVMLHASVVRDDGSGSEGALCLNDAVLSRRASAGMVTIAAFRQERELATYSGDGVIVASPLGSTAYSLAAGGPVLSPRLEALVLTPLASHSLTLRPLVVPLRDGIELLVQDAGGDEPCALQIDGQVAVQVGVGEHVRICPAGNIRFRHLTRGPGAFYDVLRDKFGWADDPRRRR